MRVAHAASTRRAGRSARRRRSRRSSRSAGSSCRSAGAAARSAAAFSGVSSQAGLVAGDRLVLGAVVLEHAAQVAQAREQQQVAEEDRRAHDALDQPEQRRGVQLRLDQADEPDRDDEEQADREGERDDERADPGRARRARSPSAAPLLARRCSGARRGDLRVGGDVRARAGRSPASRRARRRRARAAGAARGGAAAPTRTGSVCTAISPARAPRGRRASAAARRVGSRTATDQVRTPRIITPSSTACPPIGASRSALPTPRDVRVLGTYLVRGWLRGWRLRATRRWKRSTRPPVSISFWRPV